jgi:hypothetical protein
VDLALPQSPAPGLDEFEAPFFEGDVEEGDDLADDRSPVAVDGGGDQLRVVGPVGRA